MRTIIVGSEADFDIQALEKRSADTINRVPEDLEYNPAKRFFQDGVYYSIDEKNEYVFGYLPETFNGGWLGIKEITILVYEQGNLSLLRGWGFPARLATKADL